MTNFQKMFSALVAFIVTFLIITFYPTNSRVLDATIKSYQMELETASGTISQKRNEREMLKKQYQEKDNSLSGAINETKDRIEKLKLCIEAKSLDCKEAKKTALVSLVSSAYAGDEASPEPIIGEPIQTSVIDKTGFFVIQNYRNEFTCDKREKTTAIEYHYTAENYDSQKTNEDKLLALWKAHTSPTGRIKGDWIGYHYVIAKDGTIYNTRNKDCRAIADAGYEKELMSNENTEHIHISFIGDDKPTDAQTKAMIFLWQKLLDEYGLSRDSITSHAENAPKNAKENISYWYGSKWNFLKDFSNWPDRKIQVYRGGILNEAATYAWNTYKDMDFMLTIDGESSWNYDTIWDKDKPAVGDYAIWFCQFNSHWHKDKILANESLSLRGKVDYCRQKYVQWKKDGVLQNMLHAYENRMARAKNLEFK